MTPFAPRSLVALGLAVGTLATGCAGGRAALAPEGRPNVLVLVVDCLRADRTRPDHPRPVASAARSLAAEGTEFTNAFSPASWTRPSVASLLTGLYPSEHGLGTFLELGGTRVQSQSLAPGVVTLAEALRAGGYATALVGEQYQLSPVFALDQGFDLYHPRSDRAPNIHHHLLEFVDAHPRRPFFAYLHYLEPHWPYCPPPRVRGALGKTESTLDLCAGWRRLDRDLQSGRVPLSDADKLQMEVRYDEEVLGLDQDLLALFRELRARDLWDRTLIVLTADHGEEFFEHADYGHGQSLHDELLRVPLIVKPAATRAAARGRVVEALVESREIVPTILELAGVRGVPLTLAPSLVPLLDGEERADTPRDFTVAETTGWVAARTLDWKLVVRFEGAREELYDLRLDPGETRDVSSEHPEQLARMRERLATWKRALRPVGASGIEALDEATAEGLRGLGYLQ